jgi:hypothetical protein
MSRRLSFVLAGLLTIGTSHAGTPVVYTPYRPVKSVPYLYDISLDGDSIVEGGAGTVSLYRIEP